MNSRLRTGVATALVALGMAIPSTGLAAGHGHAFGKAKPCPTHRHTGKHMGAGKGHKNGSSKGKKCGK